MRCPSAHPPRLPTTARAAPRHPPSPSTGVPGKRADSTSACAMGAAAAAYLRARHGQLLKLSAGAGAQLELACSRVLTQVRPGAPAANASRLTRLAAHAVPASPLLPPFLHPSHPSALSPLTPNPLFAPAPSTPSPSHPPQTFADHVDPMQFQPMVAPVIADPSAEVITARPRPWDGAKCETEAPNPLPSPAPARALQPLISRAARPSRPPPTQDAPATEPRPPSPGGLGGLFADADPAAVEAALKIQRNRWAPRARPLEEGAWRRLPPRRPAPHPPARSRPPLPAAAAPLAAHWSRKTLPSTLYPPPQPRHPTTPHSTPPHPTPGRPSWRTSPPSQASPAPPRRPTAPPSPPSTARTRDSARRCATPSTCTCAASRACYW
jgi:hypothetical protein